MAFCYSVARRGLEDVDHSAVRDLLSGKRDDLYDFYGGAHLTAPLISNQLHRFHLAEQDGLQTVLVHLLASLGGPVYEVVVGRNK